MFRWIIGFLGMAVLVACNSEKTLDPKVENLGRATGPVAPSTPKGAPPRPAVHDMPPPTAEGSGPVKIINGEVLETIDVSRYTYVHVRPPTGEPIWTAIPQTPLEVGAQVAIAQSIVMENFESKTLKRTFPSIVFGVLHQGAPGDDTAPASSGQ